MKALSKFGLLLAVALMASAALAATAQAVVINPPGTLITGTAVNPTLNYGSQVVTCATGTAVGTTSNPASDVVNVNVQFQEPCDVSGLDATVTCTEEATPGSNPTVRLRALTADTNLGEADELLSNFLCEVNVSGICTITVGPQDLPISGGLNSANLVNEGNSASDFIDADVDVFATNDNTLCGPVPSGNGGFQADYDLDTVVTFDP